MGFGFGVRGPVALSAVMVSAAIIMAMPAPVVAEDVAERTVFLVCEGNFYTRETSPLAAQMASNMWAQPQALDDQFFGALYVTFTYTDDGFREVSLQPFERDDRLLTQKFVPTSTRTGLASPDHRVWITASEDEVKLGEYRASGAHVRARLADDPLANTRMQIATVDMVMNRFSGKMIITWDRRQVLDVKPRGALRATKVSFLDRKQFDATCRTMKEKLF